MKTALHILLLVNALSTIPAYAETIVRGPYLQLPSDTSITLRWRTDLPGTGSVFYGTAPTNLAHFAVESGTNVDHEVTLFGLSPATAYYYAIQSGTLVLAAGEEYRFSTFPQPGTDAPLRAWIIGDPGTGNATARSVYDAYRAFAGTDHTDLILTLGDNAYLSGTDEEFQAGIFDMYPEMLCTTPIFPTLGNHDALSSSSTNQSGPYYDIFSLPANAQCGGAASGTEAYYSFDFGRAHFVCLDSMDSDRTTNGNMFAWLEQDLAACTSRWLIAFWHHPPYSKGSHDSDVEIQMSEMRSHMVPLLEQHGVDLVLCGHSHNYERTCFMDGHYGLSDSFDSAIHGVNLSRGQASADGVYIKPEAARSPHTGTPYVVAGASGIAAAGMIGDHPAMITNLLEAGSVVLDIAGNRLDLIYLNSTGAVSDSFTVVKDESDIDEDGMPDLWEQDTFQRNVQPGDNADHDPADNLSEYIAGTDALDPASYFRITTNRLEAAGYRLQWIGVSNRFYTIRWAPGLTHPMEPIGPPVLFPQNSYTDTVYHTRDAGYYSIEVRMTE